MSRLPAALRRMGLLSLLLLGVDFLDELSSGVPFVGAPDIQTEFGLSYGMAAGWLLAAMGLLAFLLEPPIFLLADRYPRRWFVSGGLAALAGTCVLAGLAPSYWVLLVAVLLFGPASGCGVGLAQATLMDAHPEERERMMTRWTLMGVLGDLATPALFLLLALVHGGWRAAFLISGAILLVYAWLLSRRRFPERRAEPAGEDAPPLREVLARALKNRALLAWMAGLVLVAFLDEIFVAFGTLYMRDHLGAGLSSRSLLLGCWMGGGVVGLVTLDRLLARVAPLRLLAVSSALGTLLYLLWLLADDLVVSACLLFATGVACAGLYPLAKAQAYRCLPGQSGTVNAVSSLFSPVTYALPLLLGFVADRWGLGVTMLLLVAEPAGLLLLALAAAGRPSGES